MSRWRGRNDPGELLSETVSWQPEAAGEPFVLSLPTFFEDALS